MQLTHQLAVFIRILLLTITIASSVVIHAKANSKVTTLTTSADASSDSDAVHLQHITAMQQVATVVTTCAGCGVNAIHPS